MKSEEKVGVDGENDFSANDIIEDLESEGSKEGEEIDKEEKIRRQQADNFILHAPFTEEINKEN